MNVKLNTFEIKSVLERNMPVERVGKALQSYAQKSGLLFPIPTIGAGYYQWDLPGNDWLRFQELPEGERDEAVDVYMARKSEMQTLLEGSPLQEQVLTLPSDTFIFFRHQGKKWEIALTGWGFKYPDRGSSNEIDTWIQRHEKQNVNIGFSWDGNLLPFMSIRVDGYPRVTGEDGLLHFDHPVPVDRQILIETSDGKKFTITVIKGKSDYIFNLTESFRVEINVKHDGKDKEGCEAVVSFNGSEQTVVTDSTGHAELRIPLVCDLSGASLAEQPLCSVSCNGETKVKTPASNNDRLRFDFGFDSPKVTVKVHVKKGGVPIAREKCTVSYNGKVLDLTTGANGEATTEFKLNEDAQMECLAKCKEQTQTLKPSEEMLSLEFFFEFPADVVPTVEFNLLDYGGKPLANIPFVLTLKSKGEVELKTDENGKCTVPQEWFTPKEKMNVKFTVDEEYQRNHDIYLKKKQIAKK